MILNLKIQAQIHEDPNAVFRIKSSCAAWGHPPIATSTSVVKGRCYHDLPYQLKIRKLLVITYIGGTITTVNMWVITYHVRHNAKAFSHSRILRSKGGKVLDVLGTDLRHAPFGPRHRKCPRRASRTVTSALARTSVAWSFQGPRILINHTWPETWNSHAKKASPLHTYTIVRIPYDLHIQPGYI